MKNENLTELVFILDRSGSMAGLESDTIGGFNGMIGKQKKEAGEAFVTTYLFDHRLEMLHDRIPISEINPMTDKDYSVGGSTALLDAVGNAIEHIKKIHRYIRKEDIPAHTIFVITTDGMENASHTYTYDKIKKLITQQKENGWEFLFLGANIDAPEVAAEMGIARECSANYCSDEMGTAMMYASICAPIAELRKGKKIRADWKKDLEKDSRRK